MTGLPLSLLSVGAILVAAAAVGYGVAGAFVPRGRAWRAERISWGFAAGLALVGGSVALSFAFHGTPGWGTVRLGAWPTISSRALALACTIGRGPSGR